MSAGFICTSCKNDCPRDRFCLLPLWTQGLLIARVLYSPAKELHFTLTADCIQVYLCSLVWFWYYHPWSLYVHVSVDRRLLVLGLDLLHTLRLQVPFGSVKTIIVCVATNIHTIHGKRLIFYLI